MKEYSLSIPELITVLTCLENHLEMEVTLSATLPWKVHIGIFYTFFIKAGKKAYKVCFDDM